MFNVTIDGIPVQVEEGTTILEAAKQVGVHIPTLCFLEDVSDIGMCRMCSVKVEGNSRMVTACNTAVAEGMSVITSDDEIEAYRRIALDLIISDHGLDSTNYCFSCAKNGACELQALCRELGVEHPSFATNKERKPVLDSNPFLRFDPNLCIRCQRCVGACNNQAHNHTMQTGKRGVRTTILAPFGEDWDSTSCESCGCCAQACPVGAIVEKRRVDYREWEVKHVTTTCPHCAVGCQLDLSVKNGKVVDAQGADGPTNKGMLCVKGRSASFDFVDAPDRITTPLVKNHDTGEFEPATWDEALDLVASKFTEIKQQNGGEALAAFACSRSTNEDVYLFQKMARCAFETQSVDNCARV